MKIKIILVIMMSLLLLAAGPLSAEEQAKTKVNNMETYRKAILQHAKLDIKKFTEQLTGGLADGKAVTEFPLKQLLMGIEAEKEHTNNPMLALEIAMDHLVELNDYYTRLEVMEHGHGNKMAAAAHRCGMMKNRSRARHPRERPAAAKSTRRAILSTIHRFRESPVKSWAHCLNPWI